MGGAEYAVQRCNIDEAEGEDCLCSTMAISPLIYWPADIFHLTHVSEKDATYNTSLESDNSTIKMEMRRNANYQLQNYRLIKEIKTVDRLIEF